MENSSMFKETFSNVFFHEMFVEVECKRLRGYVGDARKLFYVFTCFVFEVETNLFSLKLECEEVSR